MPSKKEVSDSDSDKYEEQEEEEEIEEEEEEEEEEVEEEEEEEEEVEEVEEVEESEDEEAEEVEEEEEEESEEEEVEEEEDDENVGEKTADSTLDSPVGVNDNNNKEEVEEDNVEQKSADSTLDSPVAVTDNNEDSSQEVESEGQDEDLKLKESEGSLAVDAHNTSGGKFDCDDTLKMPVDRQVKEVEHVGDGDSKSHSTEAAFNSFEDKMIHESLSKEEVDESQQKNEAAIEACKDAQIDYDEAPSNQSDLGHIISVGDEETRSPCTNEEKVAAETRMGDVSASIFTEEMEKMADPKPKSSSSITPQIRPRSLSPAAEYEEGNKRPAIVCDFFARGWCIKGSACKFLHQRDGMTNTGKSTKQDGLTAISKDKVEKEGSRAEKRNPFYSSEPVGSSDVNNINSFGHSSSVYGDGINSFGHDKRIVEPASLNLDSKSVPYGSHTSVGPYSSPNTSYNASFPSKGVASSHQPFPWSGTARSERSSLDGDQGYYSSRSSFLHRHSSSPFYSRPTNNWEPSIPFRPSFNFSSFTSSPRSQYDPLLDSIDPPNGGDGGFQEFSFRQRVTMPDISNQWANNDHMSFPQQPQYGAVDKNISTHGIHAVTTPEATGISVAEKQNRSSLPKEGRSSKSARIIKALNANAVKVDYDRNHQADGSNHKESKMLKHFRSSLVEFVKELVKPHWRDGHLSKDAHNAVVRKAVEKVLSTIHPHQVPNNAELTDQYLSSSRPKLTKLVEGYVGKFTKS